MGNFSYSMVSLELSALLSAVDLARSQLASAYLESTGTTIDGAKCNAAIDDFRRQLREIDQMVKRLNIKVDDLIRQP